MPANTDSPRPDEPRIFPLWYWVVGAFVLLIAAWGTLMFIAREHPVQSFDPQKGETFEPPAKDPAPAPAGEAPTPTP